MVKIEFNQKLFDKHIKSLNNKLIKKIDNLDCSKFSPYTICCLNEIKTNSKIIIGANNKELKKIIKYFEANYFCSIGYDENQDSELYTVLSKIFTDENSGLYKNFTNYKKQHDAYDLVKGLNLKTCPYCNRNYTFVVDSDNGKLRPELDHFYPKSIYPFLAVSFYNLIPSCPICNHTKGNKVKKDLDNPYDIETNNYRFTYTPNNIDFTIVEKEKYNFDSFDIELKGNESNIKLFKLIELYKQHKDIVQELLIKKAYYPESYIEELEKSFRFSKDEIYRYLLGNYNKEEDLHKRPLSKLIRDISEELGLT